MELLDLKNKVESIVDAQIENIPQKLRAAAVLQDANVLSQFTSCPDFDLSEDFTQPLFQYYLADRKEKKQDFTPKSLAYHLARNTASAKTVLDLCAGTGALTIQAWGVNPNRYFVCEESDDTAFSFLLFNMCLRNMSGEAHNKDVLTGEWECGYLLKKGGLFSSIEKIEEPQQDVKADAVISNPPFNIKWTPPLPLESDPRFDSYGIPPAGNANLAFVLTGIHRLNHGGTASFILPCGVLSERSEKEIRERITLAGVLRSVELMPGSMFESTDVSTSVLTFGAGSEETHPVDVVDWRACAKPEMREQRGQYGGASHTNRVYKKQINVLDYEKIPLKCSVTPEDIRAQEWNWNPAGYISPPETEYRHRPFEHIVSDLCRINAERNTVKITINHTLAKTIGLDKIAELQEETVKNTEEIGKIVSAFGRHYTAQNYISLSKNKNEVKIENNSKESVSSIFSIILPMWNQHMYFLNNEENRVLTELREALTNDLMSGKLDVESISPTKMKEEETP